MIRQDHVRSQAVAQLHDLLGEPGRVPGKPVGDDGRHRGRVVALRGLFDVAPQVGLDVKDDRGAAGGPLEEARQVGPVRPHRVWVAEVGQVRLLLARARARL